MGIYRLTQSRHTRTAEGVYRGPANVCYATSAENCSQFQIELIKRVFWLWETVDDLSNSPTWKQLFQRKPNSSCNCLNCVLRYATCTQPPQLWVPFSRRLRVFESEQQITLPPEEEFRRRGATSERLLSILCLFYAQRASLTYFKRVL